MGKVDFEYKYPCGYEVKILAKSFLLKLDISDEWFKTCPLHAENCSKWVGVDNNKPKH